MKSSVIIFPGSNCDRDMDVALKKYGFKNHMVWHNDLELPKSDLVVLPGGFSYGDYLRCGSMAAKSQIMQSVGDNLMGDSGIFDRQKPGRSHGFVPNFLDKSDLPNVITIGSGDTIDGRNVYKLKDGRLFKPVKSGKQKPLSTVSLNDFISGQVMTNSGIKDAKIRYSTLAASTLGKRSDFRKFTTDPGRSYEDKLTPYMGKAHPNLQIDYGQKSGIRFTNKAKFGSGTDSFMKRWK